jgi:hypothetical protein
MQMASFAAFFVYGVGGFFAGISMWAAVCLTVWAPPTLVKQWFSMK